MKNRNEKILSMRNEGMTLQEIGDVFNISRQRVHQILNTLGFHRNDLVKQRRMEQIYDYIVDYMTKYKGNFPGVRRISLNCTKTTSSSSARYYLSELERIGKLKKIPNTHDYMVVGSYWYPPK